jgi:4-hydroxy-tetrahydrodipicolinate synthase
MQGIHTAIVTPFDDTGALDLPALERTCARQIDGRVHGIVACGTTGESPTLSREEWRQVVQTSIAVSAGRVPVTAGIGTNDTRSSCRNAEEAAQLGAQYGLLVFPYYNKPNPEGLRRHVREVARVGLPLVLYHVPGRTGQLIPAPLLAELAGFEGIAGIKEATGDLRYGGDLIARTDTPVLSGDDFTFLPLLALGGTGCVSVLSNIAPGQTVAVYEHFQAGRTHEAALQMSRLWDLTTFLFSDSSPAPCKAALAELGLCGPDPRLPLARYSGPSPRAILDAALA